MNHETDVQCPKCNEGQLWFFYEWTDDGVDTSFVAVTFDPDRRDCTCPFSPSEFEALELRVSVSLQEPSE